MLFCNQPTRTIIEIIIIVVEEEKEFTYQRNSASEEVSSFETNQKHT